MSLAEARKSLADHLTQGIARLLAKTSITPNAITLLGFGLTVVAAGLIFTGQLFVAGIVVLIAGFFDILDGALARSINRATAFGAVLDSTLDRLAEAVLLLGILYFYAVEQSLVGILLVGVVLPSSLMVSYIRARAEGIGLKCETGLFTRAERVVIFALGLMLSHVANALTVALAVIAVFSSISVVQRLLYVWQQTKPK